MKKKITLNNESYTLETKTMYCKVVEQPVTAYQVPLSLINMNNMNPARVNDCPENNVQQIQNDFEQRGQVHPIMLELNDDTGILDPVFGCNRIRASNNTFTSGVAEIPNVKKGHIWACFFTGTDAERNKLQTRENFGAKLPETSGHLDDLVELIKDRIKMKAIKPERADVQSYIKSEAPAYAGKKFKGFWNALQKKSATLQAKFKTWDKSGMSIYFAAHNEIGLSPIYGEDGNPVAYSPGHIVEHEGKKIAVYYATQLSEAAGALFGNAARKKYFPKSDVDEVWVLFAPNSTAGRIKEVRQSFANKLKEDNTYLKPVYDRMICLPQTEMELKKYLTTGRYPLEIKLPSGKKKAEGGDK